MDQKYSYYWMMVGMKFDVFTNTCTTVHLTEVTTFRKQFSYNFVV
jgi:hypothetical protein